MARAWRAVRPQDALASLAVSDGGDGFLDAIAQRGTWQKVFTRTVNPLGKPLRTFYLYSPSRRTACIEMAKASGLALLPKPNIWRASTYGTGLLLRHAVERGASTIWLGVGGSATCDGGIGAAAALGLSLKGGQAAGARRLLTVKKIAHPFPEKYRETTLRGICDVSSPPLGPKGAVALFAPQKGAKKEDLSLLDKGLTRWLSLIQDISGEWKNSPRLGSAGGILLGLSLVFKKMTTSDGFSFLYRHLNVEHALDQADLILTTEGRFDRSSAHGKFPYQLAKKAREKKKTCLLLTGDRATSSTEPFTAVFSLSPGPQPLQESLQQTKKHLAFVVKSIASVLE